MNRRALVAHLLVPFLVAVSACGSDPDAGTHADGGAGGTNQAGGAEGTEQAGSAGSSSGGGGGISGLPEEVRDELVTMADGVKLRTRVYLPANIPPGGLPVLLEREPYGFVDTTYAGFLARMGTFWNSQRYIFVYQDVRGRYGSEGEFDPFNIEVAKQDGVATTVWIDEQPWSNGRLATIGGSYSGTTAIAAAANNPLVDVVIADDYIEGFKYEILGGQHSLHTLNWARYLDSNMWMVDQVFFKLGDTFELTNLDETTLGHPFAGLAEPRPAHFHHIIQRVFSSSLFPDSHVERQRNERPFRVIADHRIAGITVRFIELSPRIETGFLDVLPESARRTQDPGDRPAEQFEKTLFRDQTGAREEQIVVVRGDALEHPQQACMRFCR